MQKKRSRWKRLATEQQPSTKVFIHVPPLPDGGRIVYDPRTGIAELEIKTGEEQREEESQC
jgi:hypothetical protein